MGYYIAVNGEATGPLSFEQLMVHGITGTTPVWRADLVDWRYAAEVPELRGLLAATATAKSAA